MPDVLANFFTDDLRCGGLDASLLARLARERVPAETGSAEDTDEDIVVRLSDPRAFGIFAGGLLSEIRLALAVRMALAEHVFDLLPLPQSEGEVILVESRAPPDLLRTAQFLSREDGFTVLHAMHLLYALFLDRSLVSGASRETRAEVLSSVLHQSDASPRLCVLYACFHLAAVPEREAHDALNGVLKDRGVSEAVKELLARTVAAPDDRGSLARLAREEGLLPSEQADEAPATVASVPQLHGRLRALGDRWLARHSGT